MKIIIILILTCSTIYSQAMISISNCSTEDIEVKSLNDVNDYKYVQKSKRISNLVHDKNILNGTLLWRLKDFKDIEKFEYDKDFLKEFDFTDRVDDGIDIIRFNYLGEKKWEINCFKVKDFKIESQITFVNGKKYIVPLETNYSVFNKLAEPLQIKIIIDDNIPLNLGAICCAIGRKSQFAKPKNKKLIYRILSKDKIYEDLIIDLSSIDLTKIQQFNLEIYDENKVAFFVLENTEGCLLNEDDSMKIFSKLKLKNNR